MFKKRSDEEIVTSLIKKVGTSPKDIEFDAQGNLVKLNLSNSGITHFFGAIMPLMETYKNFAPFPGVIIAGPFTDNALKQLKSLGFTVLYFPPQKVVSAFKLVNIEAAFNERTPDSELASKVAAWEALSEEEHLSVANALIDVHADEVAGFMAALKNAVTRQIEFVRVLPIHGTIFCGKSIAEAIEFIEKYDEAPHVEAFMRYEVEVRYMNGDFAKGDYQDKARVIEFLRIHQIPSSLVTYEQGNLIDTI